MYIFAFAVVALVAGIAYLVAPDKVAAKAAEKRGAEVTPAMIKKTRLTSLFFFVMAALFSYLGYYMEFG